MAEEKKEKPRFKDGKITRYGMEMTIKEGGSVMIPDGRTITKLDELPSEADLAKGDPELEESVAKDLQRQIKDLQSQLKQVQSKPESTGAGNSGNGEGSGTGGTGTQS